MGLIKAMIAITMFFIIDNRMNLTDAEALAVGLILAAGVFYEYHENYTSSNER